MSGIAVRQCLRRVQEQLVIPKGYHEYMPLRGGRFKRGQKHEKERCTFKRPVENVYAVAGHHDGAFACYEYLDIQD